VLEIQGSVRDGLDAPYGATAVLERATLAAIAQANEAFLVLIGCGAGEPGASSLGLDAAIAARVRELAPAERARAAACPYTLFNLRFEDAGFWRAQLAAADAPPAAPAARLEFARTAVFLAWHLAHSHGLAAALVLGMSADVQRAWRALPLSVLEGASQRVQRHLTARFGSYPSFWQRLLGGEGSAAPAAAESARLHGLQLLAGGGAWPGARA